MCKAWIERSGLSWNHVDLISKLSLHWKLKELEFPGVLEFDMMNSST